MSDTQAVEAGAPKVGETFGGKYKVVEALSALGGRLRWRVEDPEHAENKEGLVMTAIGAPSKEAEADKIKRGFERTQRAASWIRHPGVIVPRDFLYEGQIIYSLAPAASDVSILAYMKENEPKLPQLVSWTIELASMLEQLHESRQPQFLGRIPLENVRIKGEGQIQLLGFDVSPDMKLEFRPLGDCKAAPEAKYDARSDVWAISSVLHELIEKSGAPVKKVFKEETDLRNLMNQAEHAEPEKRVPNMSTLKGRLEKMRWKDAPKPKTHGVMDAPIQVLTVTEKDPARQVWDAHRPYLLVGIAGFLFLIALLVNLMPQSE